MRGLKNTLIAGTPLMNVDAASCSSANRSTERPPPPPNPPPPRPPRPPPPSDGASAKVIEPVIPTENEFHCLPENGNAKPVSVARLVVIGGPKSGSHCS